MTKATEALEALDRLMDEVQVAIYYDQHKHVPTVGDYETVKQALQPSQPPSNSEALEALESMPSLVGTPGTSAYQRSNEACAKWYTLFYKTIRQALQPREVDVEALKAEVINAVFQNWNPALRVGKDATVKAIDAAFSKLHTQGYLLNAPDGWRDLDASSESAGDYS